MSKVLDLCMMIEEGSLDSELQYLEQAVRKRRRVLGPVTRVPGEKDREPVKVQRNTNPLPQTLTQAPTADEQMLFNDLDAVAVEPSVSSSWVEHRTTGMWVPKHKLREKLLGRVLVLQTTTVKFKGARVRVRKINRTKCELSVVAALRTPGGPRRGRGHLLPVGQGVTLPLSMLIDEYVRGSFE